MESKVENHIELNTKVYKRTKPTFSIILGIIVSFIVIRLLMIEIKGRKALIKTPEEWQEILKMHPYQQPKETDARSPCPVLNTLANHGFLARDGRQIKPNELFDAVMMLGISPTIGQGIIQYSYSKLQAYDPAAAFLSQFLPLNHLDLDRLTVYGVLEHDVSLSRNDVALAPHNTSHVIPAYIERMIKFAEKFNNESKDYFTRQNEHDIRKIRWLESTRDNKYLNLRLFDQLASSAECTLLMEVIGRNGVISSSHLHSFLLNERIPDDWYPRTSTHEISSVLASSLKCWYGVRQSKATLDILNQLD